MVRRKLIISNTTPVINFAGIGRLDLLEKLFGNLVVPPAVLRELHAKQHLFPDVRKAIPSLTTITPANRLLVEGFRAVVHEGEAECLALAMENPDSLVLLDDLQARALATASHLRFTGTLGCLVEAKERAMIDTIAPLVEALRSRARFWIASDLEQRVLEDAGEGTKPVAS